MKRIIWAAIAACIPFALYWIGDGDFVRNSSLAVTVCASMCAGFFTYTFYGKDIL